MTILLYDLVFNVACFFHECHFFVYLVASVLYCHVVMGAISIACEQALSGMGAQQRERWKELSLYCAPTPERACSQATISKAFPNIARLPHSLYITSSSRQIPIKKCHASGVGQVFIRQIDSNLGVLQGALLLMLCNSLKQCNFIPLSCQIYFIQPLLLFVLYLQSLSS